jgi:hypothetical protein
MKWIIPENSLRLAPVRNAKPMRFSGKLWIGYGSSISMLLEITAGEMPY